MKNYPIILYVLLILAHILNYMNKNLLIILILIAVAGALWYLRGDNGGENYPFTNPELTERYEDEGLGFFVDYPEGFMVNNTEEENVKVLGFSEKDSDPPARLAEAPAKRVGEAGESFQIFIMPYDEPGPITPERIFIDQPEMVIKDPQTVQIAGEEALVFFSKDPDIGDVREVWFVHGDHLYQASTYAKYDELLAKVMATFRFK